MLCFDLSQRMILLDFFLQPFYIILQITFCCVNIPMSGQVGGHIRIGSKCQMRIASAYAILNEFNKASADKEVVFEVELVFTTASSGHAGRWVKMQ